MKSIATVKVGDLRDPNPETKGKVAVVDIPTPEVGDEDVLIKVGYCSICGSDPHVIGGIFGWEAPYGLGHEVSGVIVGLGKEAAKGHLKIGDRIAGNFLHFCGHCYYCQNGQQQFCENIPPGNAGMAEYTVWHQSQVFKLPDSISLRQGCLLEPLSVAVRIADKLDMKIGQRICINGSGPIGLFALQLLKMFGATSLTVFEPNEERRKVAIGFGADHAIDPTQADIYETAMSLTEGRGFDAVIDASGAYKVVATLPPLVAKGGLLLFAGMYPNTFEMPLNLYKYCYMNEIAVTGFYVSPYTYPRALQLLTKVNLEKFTEISFPIDQPEQAFEAQLSGKYLKVMIECNSDLADL